MMALILGGILLVVAVLVFTDGSARIAGVIEPDQLAGLAFGVAMLALVTAGFWRRVSGSLSEGLGLRLRDLAVWLAIGLACVVGYAYRDEVRGVSARVMGELSPGSAVTGPGGRITISRRAGGDFRVDAQVNGRAQSFAFDTGASAVVLTAENAEALGLRPAEADYSVRVSTANGTALAAPMLIDTLSIGPITERGVPALIARPGVLRENLLGQSFLSRLPGYEVRGDRLILQGR